MEAVNVVIRFRGGEVGQGEGFADWKLYPASIKHPKKDYDFNFDAVLSSEQSQADLYDAAGRKIIDSL